MNRRYLKIMFGLGGMIAGLSLLGGGEILGGIALSLGGLYLLSRQFEESRTNRERQRQAERTYERWQQDRRSQGSANRPDNVQQIYPHALRAVADAGHRPEDMPVLPVDIGVLAHRGDEPPQLYRTQAVPDDVDYIQPYVQLRIPTRAQGTVTFELLDDRGELLFYREEPHTFNAGLNLIVPERRLPVHDALDMDEGAWTLRVSADGTVLAVHGFGWREASESIVVGHIKDDGEISNELRAAMAESRLESMSLDELLAFQDDKPPRQQRSQSAQQ